MAFAKGVVLAKAALDAVACIVFMVQGNGVMSWMFVGFTIADIAVVML